ncbi:MAG: hypothetical protein ACLQUY_03465 [Ktedonobacterales bacterium]
MDISEWETLLNTNPITLDPAEHVTAAGSGVLYVSQSQALKEAIGAWIAEKRAQGFELIGVTRPNTANPDVPDGHGYFHEVQITFKGQATSNQP